MCHELINNEILSRKRKDEIELIDNDMNPKPNISRIRKTLLDIQIKDSVKALLKVL